MPEEGAGGTSDPEVGEASGGKGVYEAVMDACLEERLVEERWVAPGCALFVVVVVVVVPLAAAAVVRVVVALLLVMLAGGAGVAVGLAAAMADVERSAGGRRPGSPSLSRPSDEGGLKVGSTAE